MDELELLRQRVQQLEAEMKEARLILSSELYQLRVPLVPLKGFVRSLLDDEKEEWYTREDRREFYTILDENIDRLSRHLYILQELADIQVGRFAMQWQEGVDVHELTRSVVAPYQERTDKQIIALDFEPEGILIETDLNRFETILYCLLHRPLRNALDGGKVRVCARLEPPGKEWSSETLLLQFEDPFIGLMNEILSHAGRIRGRKIIETPPAGPDMTSRLIRFLVEAHQGALWFESEGSGGSMKTISNLRIPVKQPKQQDSI